MTSSTLTDRYVWAVLRSVPSDQRKDLEPEVRALVADAIDARAGAGETDAAAAERAALTELGDPSALAARYTDRTLALIGPALYPEWRRLLTTLLPIVPPIVGFVVLGADLLSGESVGQAIAGGIGTAFSVVVQMTFWITLVFAMIERTVGTTGLEHSWSPNDLPDLPAEGRTGIVEFAVTLVFDVLVIVALLWVQLAPPIVIEGLAYPLFDPALWSFWLPYFLVVLVIEALLTIAIFMHGRWTYAFATINAVLSAAVALPAVYLMLDGKLFNPALVDALNEIASGSWFGFTSTFIALIVLGISAFDAIDGFLKARRADLATTGATVGQ